MPAVDYFEVMRSGPTAADWWLVGIGGVAALATTLASIASWRAASAARATAQILREERGEAIKSRMAAPLMDLRSLLAEYTIGIDPGQEGGQSAKATQRQVKAIIEREGLASRLPKTAKFANSTMNELSLAEEAFSEIQDVISKTMDEGSAFRSNR